MCTVVDYGDESYSSIGELKKLWPKLVNEKFYKNPPKDNDSCLCSVDIPATAKLHGFRVRGHVFGYKVIGRKPAESAKEGQP